ncbi:MULTISPECIES: SDR family NAD(P)-dependent oxidoreductase [unclassified Streptomyces]|uniref:SDR family oxidoreductase n=1 Tax=unclassified Streptomyces TaxID=2593676 RepID=UPI00341A1218
MLSPGGTRAPEAGPARKVVVTGGTRGIGREVVDRFAAAGDSVVSLSRSGAPVEGALSLACDVGEHAAVEEAMARAVGELGGLDVLVVNAGIVRDNLMARMTAEEFTTVVQANLMGAFYPVRAGIRSLLRSTRGRVVFCSSTAALLGGVGQGNYAASKSGLIGLARTLARELARGKTTVNVIMPGLIDTDMGRDFPEKVRQEFLASVPLRRAGTVAEVASLITYLASDEARYITGAVIPVDGGVSMGV